MEWTIAFGSSFPPPNILSDFLHLGQSVDKNFFWICEFTTPFLSRAAIFKGNAQPRLYAQKCFTWNRQYSSHGVNIRTLYPPTEYIVTCQRAKRSVELWWAKANMPDNTLALKNVMWLEEAAPRV
jgi:hypothetical protein